MERKTLDGNQLKVIAMTAMTIDHVTCVLFPGYPKDWWILLLHIIGRMAAPIFWFFVAEGYHYTHDRKQYAGRLLVFAIVSAVALGVMVPSLAKQRKEHQPPVTNGSPLTIGKQGVVLTAIEPGLPGRVRVDGLDWQAKAGVTLAPDTRIVVNAVDGAILIVSPVTEKTTV